MKPKWAIVNEDKKTIETFRSKLTADQWIYRLRKNHLQKLKIVRYDEQPKNMSEL